MKIIRYLFEYIFIIILFGLSKLLGYRVASGFGCFIGQTFGPFFRSKKIIQNNLIKFDNSLSSEKIINISKKMWGNYGRILAEYPHISSFRKGNLDQYIKIENKEKLEEIKSGQPVVFVSAHFSNFELMAMAIEKAGVNLSAIYRPLNNKMVNSIMEPLRKKYICKNQIKKGIKGVKKTIEYINNNNSIALMIDQRVSEGERINFFKEPALTTTLPAQLSSKFEMDIIPVFIERNTNNSFNIEFQKRINPTSFKNKLELSEELNKVIEKMIVKNPYQWIWTHNRWK